MLFAVEFSMEALGIIGTLGLFLTGTIGYLFKLLMEAKDAQIALRLKESENINILAMTNQAATNLEIAAAKYAASIGKPVPDALVPVVPRHNSPTTKEQRDDANLQTLQARITRATLILDLPARQPAVMESMEDAAVRKGKPQPTKEDVIIEGLNEIKRGQADERAKVLIDQIAPQPTPVVVANVDPVVVKIEGTEKEQIAKAVVEAINSPVSLEESVMHKGTVVSVTPTTITMSHTDGSPNDTHDVETDADITLNNKPAKLTDLKAGDVVEVKGDPATCVKATGPR